MRLLAVAALALALTACGIAGPSQTHLTDAVRAYFAEQTETGRGAALAAIDGAAISDYEGCQPLSGVYRCAVWFAAPNGRTSATIWLVRDANGWVVQNIVVNDAEDAHPRP